MIAVALWEPLALAAGAAFLFMQRGGEKTERAERIRDVASILLAVVVSALVRNAWLPVSSDALRPLRLVLAIVAYDFALYWLHRFCHGPGWRLHHAHHAPRHFGAGMAFRDSAGHLIINTSLLVAISAAFGLGDVELALLSSLFILLQWWTHTRTWMSLGLLDRVFIGPRHHCVHHLLPLKGELTNLGGFLCIWDQLFGTYRHPPEVDPSAERGWPRRSPARLRSWLGV